ncbi:MAG: hypothetical protein ABIN72_04365 [Sphingomicrobium sp.]
MLPLFIAAAVQGIAPAATPIATLAPADTRQTLQDCNAHKFDTVVTAEVKGAMQSKLVRLCGQVGQSDSQWVKTLEDSIAKLAANASIAKPMREAMVTSLKVEVVRLRGSVGAARETASAPAGVPKIGEFTLKPRAVQPTKSAEGLSVYNGLPPLPDAKVAAAKEAAAYVAPPPITRPNLDFQCLSSGAIGPGPCDELDRHGFIIVRAKDGVGAGVDLHFVLNGEDRGDIALSGARKGQRLNLTLPVQVCRGTAGGKLEMRVMVTPAGGKFAPQRAETIGPLALRCA